MSKKIGVVAYEMEGRRTGLGRYLDGLLHGVAQVGNAWQWHLFMKGEAFDHPLWADPRFIPSFDGRPRARPILWEQLRLPGLMRRAGLDFVFSPAYSLPGNPRQPSMLTIHDLSFECLGEEFAWKERWRRRLLARRSVKRASRVLAVSGGIAREIERTYRVPAVKIGVVPNGIDEHFYTAGDTDADLALLRGLGVESPYLLFLGSILARRHVDLLIGAFAELAPRFPTLRLVLAGQNRLRQAGDLHRFMDASGAAERIHEIGYVPEDALVPLYRQAELSYYLSAYEGFGLPPLESLAAGTPSIVSDSPGLDDVWPEYPYRAARLDRESVVAILERALADPEERHKIATEGAKRARRLSWKRSGELFIAQIERAFAAG